MFLATGQLRFGRHSPGVARGAAILLWTLSTAAFGQAFNTQDSDFRPPTPEPRLFQDVDEVSTQNGDLTIRQKDLVLPGNGGLDIVVERVYSLNRLSAGLSASNTQSYQWTALGPGWTIRAAPRLVQENNYYYNVSEDRIIYQPTGLSQLCSNQTFFNYGSNIPELELPDGSRLQLYSVGGYRAVTKNNWKVECVLPQMSIKATSPDGTVYDFGSVYVGKYFIVYMDVMYPWRSVSYLDAVKETDVYGNWIQYSYQSIGTPITSPVTDSGTPYAEDNEQPSFVLSQITSSDGRAVSLTYDAQSGRLTTMTDNAGRSLSYSYSTEDGSNARVLAQVTVPSGDTWKYAYYPGTYLYSSDDNPMSPLSNATVAVRKLQQLTYPSGGSISYQYGFYNLSQQVGTLTTHARGERVTGRTYSTGETWTYSYTRGGAGQYDTTTVVGPEGTTTYRYMGPGYAITTSGTYPPPQYQNNAWQVGQLMQKIDPTGSTETNVWQPREVLAAYTRLQELGFVNDQEIWAPELSQRTIVRNGTTYTTVLSNYDAYGNPGTVSETGPNGGSRTTTLTYLNDTTKWILSRPMNEVRTGRSETRTLDANGRVTSISLDGIVTGYTYDSQGNLATMTQPRGLVTTYSNYKRGIAQSISEPESILVTRVVDNAGQVTSETDGELHTRTYGFDGLGRITSLGYPRGNSSSIVYTPTTKTATRGGLVEITTYDGFGRPSSISLGGVLTRYTYDYRDRLTFRSNPGGTVGTTYQYDALDRLTKVNYADSTFSTFAYGAGSVSVTDERSNVTTQNFRSYGNPTEEYLMQIAAPDSSANVVVTRGANDLVVSVTQGGVVRSYGYDVHNYLASETQPEVGTIVYGRDAAGNMISKQVGSAGQNIYGYDGQNRLNSISLPGGGAATQSYSKTNRIKTVQSNDGSRTLGYDENDNLTSESLSVDGYTLTVGYGYNVNDQLASITYPVMNRTVNYVPDVLGRPTQASGYASSVTYWPSGQINQISYANGTTTTYGQNSRLWPSSFVTTGPGGTISNTTYVYDGVGNLTNISDTVDAGAARGLGYDTINRLTGVTGPWGSGVIAYDGAGNIRSQTFGSSILSYSYDVSNRLSAISGSRSASYGYDVYGNVASSGGKTFAYDGTPVLRCADCGGADRVDYGYDGLNRRIWTSRLGLRTYELYDARGELLAEYTPNGGGKLVEHIYLGGKRVAQRVSVQGTATTVIPTQSTLSVSPGGVSLTVDVSGATSGGTVTFMENGVFLGVTTVQAGQATVILEGLSLGPHTITASYSGSAVYAPSIATFTVQVRDLSWLPAVLDLLLGN
jgi:YD repeat-containing protein